MSCSFAPCLTRLTIVAYSTLVLALLVPTAAWAGCGDYVIVTRPMMLGKAAKSDLQTQLDQLYTPTRHEPTGLPIHAPCHGPYCSKGSPSPPAPSAAPISTVQHWACLTSCDRACVADPADFVGPPEPARAECHSIPIEHPPRAI
jgi:hypothetical protein